MAPRYPNLTPDDLKDPSLTVLHDVLRSFYEELQSLRGSRGSIALQNAINMQNSPIANALLVGIGNANILSGTGSPEGKVNGNVGHVFLRTDVGAPATMYLKLSGQNTNTGWMAVAVTNP
jgi:hypothetical protein